MRIIGGEARGRRIEAPAGRNTRPTLDRIRENMFNMLQADIPGSSILDLFAGSGALSLEAISRGAKSAVLVDADRKAHMVQKQNTETLRFGDRTRLYCCDWSKAIRNLCEEGQKFDVFFLDPPYAMTDLNTVFSSLIPLMEKDAIIVLEHEAGKTVSVPPEFAVTKDRSWGFCAVTVYRLESEGE